MTLYLAGFLFLSMIILALLGETTLPLFGGDRELAARFYKALFSILGSASFGLALPSFFQWFGRFGKRIAEKPEVAAQLQVSPEIFFENGLMVGIIYAVSIMSIIGGFVLAVLYWTKYI